MRSEYPTDQEMRETLEKFLADVAAGRPPRVQSCTGLDMETENSMRLIAEAMPNPPHELIAAAHAELERQIDGTHIAPANRRQTKRLEV